jgi:midasin
MVTQMSEKNKMDLIGKLFTMEERNNLMLEMAKDNDIDCTQTALNDLNSNNLTNNSTIVDAMEIDDRSVTGACFVKEDFTGNHTVISGVVLQTLQEDQPLSRLQYLVMVPSTKRNLHSRALAVETGSGVLLEGPVGSGKTSLVENLARMTGRTSAPLLMKVQLGDQTDSKVKNKK